MNLSRHARLTLAAIAILAAAVNLLLGCGRIPAAAPEPTRTLRPTFTPTAPLAPTAIAAPTQDLMATQAALAQAVAATPTAVPEPPTAEPGTVENPIIMAFVPSGDTLEIIASGDTLAEMVSQKTGLLVAAKAATDFAAVREAMCAGSAQISWLNTFDYIMAHDQCGAEVGLATQRYGSSTYIGLIIVRGDSGITTLADLKGKTMCWVDPSSTSGYIVPRIYLQANGVNPDTDFVKTIEAGSHSNVVLAVYNGDCDAGAVFNDARSSIERDFPDVKEKVAILATTTEVPNDGMDFARDLPVGMRNQIMNALLEIAGTEEGALVLRTLFSIDGVQAVDDTFYDAFRSDLSRAGVNIEDLISFIREGVWPTTAPGPTREPTPVSGDLLNQVTAACWLAVSTDPYQAPQGSRGQGRVRRL